MNDLRFALRQLLKNPGFAAVAVLTLALGIGANTAIFSVINAVMLRPLPFPAPERLVWIEEVSQDKTQWPWGAHFLAWQEHSQTLEHIAVYDADTMTLTGSGEAERVAVAAISSGFLPLLGVQPLPPGRNLSVKEDQPGGDRVALLSHHLWQQRYGGEPDIVGRGMTLNDASYTVIGVLPEDFRFPEEFDVWVPMALDAQRELVGPFFSLQPTLARLKPGVTPEQAQAELDTLAQRYETARPEKRPELAAARTRLVPLQEHFLGATRRPLLVLLGAVALVLFIACANVANLLLARAVTRQRELAVRAALGASRSRLIRQMLTECLVLALAGGGAGWLLAYWLTRLLSSLQWVGALGPLARIHSVSMDLRVFVYALFVSVGTGLLFGLLPALRLSHQNANAALREGGRGSRSQGRGLRSALLVSEVALALVLLSGAGLLVRSFVKLIGVNPGYRPENLLTAQLKLPPRYREEWKRAQFYEEVLQRVSALPGVVSVGATSQLPLTPYNMGGFLRAEDPAAEGGKREAGAPITAVNPDYFRTLGISLQSGRIFNDGDAQGAPSVVLLSEALAHQLFADADPIGRRIFVPGSGSDWTTVIGVVEDVRHQGLDREIEQAAYLSYRQMPRPTMALVLRGSLDPSSLAAALRQAVREVDPALPVFDVRTMEARLSDSLAGRRFNLFVLGSFAALALALAGVGIYGVIAYLVTERTREIGIRMALGAQRRSVLSLVVGQGMRLAVLGIGIGLAAALALSRVLRTLLFEITPTDPLTFATIPLVLAAVALIACWLPACRAARVDPMEALRSEG